MWSHIVLCLLVGFAYASNNPGWKDNSEYVYHIRGRTLASLHEVANQYSGIIFKAHLKIQPQSNGNLKGQMSNAQYSQVHSHLSDGWNTVIPDSEVTYKHVDLTDQPFEVKVNEGVIEDLIVTKDMPNWEANIIKSAVSQFQLNTNAVGLLPSKLTALPEGGQNSAVFKTMEETVTGKTETTYDIHPMPEYVLQSQPWMARFLNLKGTGEVIEVVKHKNYSNSEELPLYHTGFGTGDYEPATNQMGDFFIRDSISRAILTGNLKRYTIQNTYTVNEIVMSPTLNNKQKGSVISVINITLHEINSKNQQSLEISSPLRLGNLVYSYHHSKTGSVKQKKPYQNTYDSDEDRYQRSAMMNRIRRAIQSSESQQSSSSSSSEETEYYQYRQPQLKNAPHGPLLPYNTGYQGMSVTDDPNVDIKKTVEKIAKDIGNNLQNPGKFLQQDGLSKFTIMTSLTRLMTYEELNEVSMNLYSQNQKGTQGDTWTTFRDAVAESGTGPAFLTIQDWIKSGKIKDEEAAAVVATTANSVRVPTKEYMKSFFELIKDSKVQTQEYLHDTLILSYTDLLRKVCVDKKQSSRQYPVNSFGKFCTAEERKEVEETVIPYFTQKLQEAISRTDTQKIHTYIRALGNIGHPKILGAFEPYLEGEKQVSQFQRLLMVAALDKLTTTKPKVARSVLYKIYQNSGDSQEVRVAAVLQLMRTNPPTDMLQRMASYTNIDTQEHVNAAVKSSIQRAANLEGGEYRWLRSSAQAAMPLLTKKRYGVQHGQNYFYNHVINELNLKSKKAVHTIGSEEEFYPKAAHLEIDDELGGFRRELASVRAMVSSIDELMHVAQTQTTSYEEQLRKQQEHSGQQKQHKFSSLNTAHLLNMKSDEREQLEGYLYSELSGVLQGFWSFDNGSMDGLPEEIRKHEEEIRSGKNYHYTKFTNNRELRLAFPTETGFPFGFTYDSPTVVKVEGQVRGEASPQLSNGQKLQKPDTIALKAELGFTVNSKTQSQMSFTTPFDGQRYISGYDKNIQVHVPLHAQFKADLKNGQIEAEIENKEEHQESPLFHYSTWPYTSKIDITNFQPVSSQKHTQYIRPKNLRSYDEIYGKKQTGVAVRVQIEHERQFINIPKLQHLMQHQLSTGLSELWGDASIQYGQINVQLLPRQSSTRKYKIHVGYQYKYNPQTQKQQTKSLTWSQLYSVGDYKARQETLIDEVTAGIKSANGYAWDASIEFSGDKTIKYNIAGALGKSNVDPKSRVVFNYKKSSDSQDEKPFEISVEADSTIPNTNGLDVTESFKTEPKADTRLAIEYGESLGSSPSKAVLQFQWRRSEERKQYLMETQMYKECQREMRDGNYQLPACANTTMSANLLDDINIDVKHENVGQDVVDAMKTVFETLKYNYYPTLEVEKDKGTGTEDKVNFQARFDPDLRSVNISIQDQTEKATIKDIQVGEWAQKVFVVHPVFHLRSRVYATALGLRTYRPICVVDQTFASTFNNKTYPVPLENHWTLLLQYVPKDARHGQQQISVEEQLQQQPEQYAVYVRKSQGTQQKDVKITLNTPQTDYKVIDITMIPSSQQGGKSSKAKVTVNDKPVEVSDQQSEDVRDGYIQIYNLPNGELKVEVENAFYVIYDGHRMKLTVVNGKFRDSIRGLCGSFNDDKTQDFLTPENCITGDNKKFIKTYEVEGSEGSQQRRDFVGRTNQCVPKEVPLYANVISEQDTGRKQHSGGKGHVSRGTKFQTRYVESDREICFTIRPVAVCSGRNQQHNTIRKSVPVHCMQKTNVAQMWKNQIDLGSSPDFNHKKETKTVQIDLPQSCS